MNLHEWCVGMESSAVIARLREALRAIDDAQNRTTRDQIPFGEIVAVCQKINGWIARLEIDSKQAKLEAYTPEEERP